MSVLIRELKDVRPALPWEPEQRAETTDFVERKHARNNIPRPALQNVVFEAQQILGRCINPSTQPQGTTGLVVGFVQSGKTLSFATLSALAHDNGFGLIILIAGTLQNLLLQTKQRLEDDLNLNGNGTTRPWMVVDTPSPDTPQEATLRKHLINWTNPNFPKEKRRVCFVIVLKQHKRLANLVECIEGIDLENVPTLIIDDEADQASLNTFAQKNGATGSQKKSANYREVLFLKKALPHHSYVQYTATPQANLLASLDDELSPDFAELLTPGDGYIGGATIFKPMGKYAATIPNAEATVSYSTNVGPPQTLVKALRIYLLGACAAEVLVEQTNRTMMVHPSQQTGLHNDYLRWVSELIDGWRLMSSDESLKHDFFEHFQNAYDDLAETVGTSLPPFLDLISMLSLVLQTVTVREVNSTGPGSAPISWNACEYWILVGGAKLDRGFTVEGLTVTYMPRPLAGGNADSLQQRARFYGYKTKYLGYCRVFLRPDVRHAFEQYVEHENDIHESLKKTRGFPLKSWVRQFILDSSMQPTRKGVVGIPYKELIAAGWKTPRAAHINETHVSSNRKVLASFHAGLKARIEGFPAEELYPEIFVDRRSASSPRNYLHEEIAIEFIIDEFLKPLKLANSEDEFERAGMIVALRALIERGYPLADVFVMGELQSQTRSITADNHINQVFSGKAPAGVNDRSNLNYGGDRSFISDGRLVLQLRMFNIKKPDAESPYISDVPWFALHIPDILKKRYLRQSESLQ